MKTIKMILTLVDILELNSIMWLTVGLGLKKLILILMQKNAKDQILPFQMDNGNK